MRPSSPLLMSAMALLLLACGAPENTPSGPGSNPGSDRQEAAPTTPRKAAPRKAYTEEELNRPYSTVSPWRYIVTGPETQYFERLVAYSELARTVHSSGHTILVPRDDTFRDNKEWKALLEEENREALDRFVKAHILIGVESPKSIDGVYENLNGETVAIERDDRGEMVCGGARLLGQEIETDQGIVLPVMGMVEEIRWN